ncbi:hypothetical protein Hbor_08710 [Halogeometricum borinquense DSM 11551]|uniref:Uncharacterized protein n=1 Tax=Halogeometricum borinquense (strain ATCC 700274 / DSM 11551 / JCM 10706 / KCTC 4070 / PR3) TaxID=469382 RepID=E4NPB2_HALBP|nr:hypothetical protein Hbor_08710 [Halogeometricum borinquense DSM 11551]
MPFDAELRGKTAVLCEELWSELRDVSALAVEKLLKNE